MRLRVVLEAQSPKSGCWWSHPSLKDFKDILFSFGFWCFCLFGLFMFLFLPPLCTPGSDSPWRRLPYTRSTTRLCLDGAFPSESLPMTLLIGFRAHPDNPGWSRFEILNLVITAKTCFPDKVTFTDSGDQDMGISFGGAPFNLLPC